MIRIPNNPQIKLQRCFTSPTNSLSLHLSLASKSSFHLHKQSSIKTKALLSFFFLLSSFSSSMADTDTKQDQLVKEEKLQNQTNPSKYYTNFLYKKAVIIIIFLIIIPVLPSQAPEFINQTLLNRSWELLHLLFVGIAVSYGLFSQRNQETEKELNNNNTNQSKFDNVQSYVSKFLQVSSVFEDEAENMSGSDHETKVQHQHTWSSQYYRNEPPVFVTRKQGQDNNNNNKPLLLPVRSLRSRVLEPSKVDETNSSSLRRSNSGLSSKRKHGESLVPEKKMDENSNIVLPSPVPWRSRSGRMEVKEDFESLSNEIVAKSAEDLVRKKTIYRSPPPPPPPPPRFVGKSSPMKPAFTKTLRFKSEPTFIEFPREEKQKFVENLVMETTTTDDDDDEDDDSESDEEVSSGSCFGSSNEETNPSPSNDIDGGSDVDKKADEFIAKVREQIRLQRIDSIKRSSGQIKRNSTR